MLYRRRIQGVTDGFKVTVAQLAFVAEDANFDQFVRIQAAADFTQDSLDEPILADGDNRVQAMGLGAQIAALGNRDFEHVFFNLSNHAFYRVLVDETNAYKQGLDARARH